ncbi:MAG: GyrI-like domain-containing protein [Asticcacaulis sp.]
MSKMDLKTEYRSLYTASAKTFVTVDVPPLSYLMFDGTGDPKTVPEYAQAVEGLFSLAYTLKFMSKRGCGRDYVVGPLEGLWRPKDFERRKKDGSWTMMILQPDWITQAHLAAAKAEVLMKTGLPGIERVRLATMHEGPCVQILHVGPYDDEGPVLKDLHERYLPAHGLRENGHPHEIYLNNPCQVSPDKLKTILRQPVKPA